MNFRVRQARRDDGAALAVFLRQLQIPARLPITVSRGEDCFALAALRGGESFWLLAENNEELIVGALELALLPVAIAGTTLTMAYVAFAGVAPEYRRQGVLLALVDEVEPLSRARGSRLGAMLHNQKNQAIEAMMAKHQRRAISAVPITVATLLASRVVRPRGDYHYEPARAEDLPAAEHLLQQRYVGYTVAPAEKLTQLLARLQLPADACWVARTPGGEVAAFIGIWDQQLIRPIALGRLPLAYSAARTALNLVAPALGLARLPGNGEILRLVFALAPAAENPQALVGLVKAVLRYLSSRGYHGMILAMPENDRLWSASYPRWAVHSYNHPLLVAGDAQVDDLLQTGGRPVLHIEYGLV